MHSSRSNRHWRTGCILVLGLACALLAPAAIAATDAPPLILEHLTTADGLPQGTVMATLQDSQGFIWLGTQDGLVRYDGHELRRYAYSRTLRTGLPGNFINQIVEDPHHDLWIAIKDGGVARWSRTSDAFTVFRHNALAPDSLSSDAARSVLVDARGQVWVATSNAGINVLDPASGHFIHLRHSAADPGSLIDDRVFTLMQDRSGQIWAGTYSGLERWQPENAAFQHIARAPAAAAAAGGSQISQIIQDHAGALWIGSFDGGLLQLDADGRLLQHYRHDAGEPTSLGDNDVRALLEDRSGRLWIGTPNGLELLNRATGEFTHYRHDDRDASSLRDSYIQSLYKDSTGLIWIGTRAGGVSRWNPHSWELGGYRPGWLEGKDVTAFGDAPGNKVWIGSLGGGLVQFDSSTGEATDIDAIVGRKEALGDPRVMALHTDRHGTLWIGTMASGLKKLAPNGRLDAIPVRGGDPHGLSDGGIMTMFESRDGALWIGTHQGGVNRLDPATGLVRQLPFGAGVTGAVSAGAASAIAEDADGNIWIGTDGGGLDLARPDGTVRRVFRHDPNDPASLPANTVYALAMDAKGRLWIATDGGGLALMSGSAAAPEAIRFRTISREEGLTSDTIYGVVPDAGGSLWLSGNAGLVRFEPDTGAIKTYHREHGLQGEEFNFGAFLRLRDGRLCFGGPGGFNIFDPLRLAENRYPPRLLLTGVEVQGVPLASRTPYWLLDHIALDYQANVVSLDVGALDFISPQRNRIAYRMAGLTDRWMDLGAQHRITLTNLEAGDHVLEVRAANADSIWSKTPLRLTIHKAPAPWRSAWAYALYVLALIGSVGYRLLRQRRELRRMVVTRERLEAEVALRTRELLDSNRQLEQAARAKSNFLDRISHELRTPMNGVVGMAELLARTRLSSTQTRLTQTIRSSAQVLLQIVNDLLDLSKVQAGKVELESLPIDLSALLEECTDLFTAAAQAKNIELIVCPPSENPGLLGDPLKIRQILMNLIGNAVKFTSHGEIVVKGELRRGEADQFIAELSVADTGIGIDAAIIQKIFEPFTQADESTTRRFGGSGLGLAICREFARVLGGTISVESRPQAGSTFRLLLPLQRNPVSSPSAPASWPPRRVLLRSRRPALIEALVRYLSALGLQAQIEDRDDELLAVTPDDVVIVDAGSDSAWLKAHQSRVQASRLALVVIASSEECGPLEGRLDSRCIVPKPVHRAALCEALTAAMGLAPAAAKATAEAAVSAEPLSGVHILLVEDEPVNASVAMGYLEALGCSSVWVETGAEAISQSAAQRFDLILMDLSMPGMNGFQTAALIREREGPDRRVPIIALTAHDAKGYRESCLQAGMDDLLTKPYTLEQCAQLLRRWIGGGTAEAPPSVPAPVRSVDTGLSSVDPTAVANLRQLRPGSQSDLYSKLVELFQTGSTRSLSELRDTLVMNDFERAAMICHKLAASAANVGAMSFAAAVRLLEQACLARDPVSAGRLHHGLQASHPSLIAELLRLQLRESA